MKIIYYFILVFLFLASCGSSDDDVIIQKPCFQEFSINEANDILLTGDNMILPELDWNLRYYITISSIGDPSNFSVSVAGNHISLLDNSTWEFDFSKSDSIQFNNFEDMNSTFHRNQGLDSLTNQSDLEKLNYLLKRMRLDNMKCSMHIEIHDRSMLFLHRSSLRTDAYVHSRLCSGDLLSFKRAVCTTDPRYAMVKLRRN